MLNMLKHITKIPIRHIKYFVGIFETIRAEIGAANIPPAISPAIISQCDMPMKKVKVMPVAMLIKNSVALTVPMVFLASPPELSRVVVTTGPQPPPPIESTNPPIKAITLILVLVEHFFK